MRNRIFISVLTFVVFCCFSLFNSADQTFAQESERIIIGKINQQELDSLMKNKENRSLVVAMASWCGPCRDELPFLVRLHSKYKDKGLKIIGISLDTGGPEAMQKVADKAKVNFPIYWAGEEAAERYGIYAIPMLYLIKNGKIIDKAPGQQSEDELERKINGLLK
jgi:thiol-disulfide isomerase/thioredoxin